MIRRHAVRRVTLHVLDVAVAFLMGEPHIVGGDVVLQIDERLAGCAHLPQRQQRSMDLGGHVWQNRRRRAKSKRCKNPCRPQRAIACARTSACDPGCGASRHNRAIIGNRNKRRGRIIPCQFQSGLTGQLDVGIAPARHRQSIDVECHFASRAVATPDMDRTQRQSARCLEHLAAGFDPEASFARRIGGRCGNARINHGNNLDAV